MLAKIALVLVLATLHEATSQQQLAAVESPSMANWWAPWNAYSREATKNWNNWNAYSGASWWSWTNAQQKAFNLYWSEMQKNGMTGNLGYPTVQAPAPIPQAPAPTTQAPAPTPQAPAPTPQAPAPTPQAPAPTPQAPAPTPQAPAPAPEAPAPTPEAPAPTPQAPAPTPQAPAPTPQAPAPTPQAPAPTPQAPAPAPQAPAPGDVVGQEQPATLPVPNWNDYWTPSTVSYIVWLNNYYDYWKYVAAGVQHSAMAAQKASELYEDEMLASGAGGNMGRLDIMAQNPNYNIPGASPTQALPIPPNTVKMAPPYRPAAR